MIVDVHFHFQPNVQIEIFNVKSQAHVKYVTLTNSERFKIEN